MNTIIALLSLSGGVLASFLLPILFYNIQQVVDPDAERGSSELVKEAKRWLVISAFSLVTGLILLASLSAAGANQQLDWSRCLLLGYAWDSTCKKWRVASKVGKPEAA